MQLTEINKSTDMSDQESTLCCAVPRTLLADTYIDTNFFFFGVRNSPLKYVEAFQIHPLFRAILP